MNVSSFRIGAAYGGTEDLQRFARMHIDKISEFWVQTIVYTDFSSTESMANC